MSDHHVSFTVNSGALRVTDPCYQVKDGLGGTLAPARNGVWAGRMETRDDPWLTKCFHERVDGLRRMVDNAVTPGLAAEFQRLLDECGDVPWRAPLSLTVHHVDFACVVPDKPACFDVSVDSGCAGAFDLAPYESAHQPNTKEAWYAKQVIQKVGGGNRVESTPEGLWCHSGGDGTYRCLYGCTHDGDVVAVKILFWWPEGEGLES